MSTKNELQKRLLTDIKVELSEEYDGNFTRKAFFDRPWTGRQGPKRRGTLMAVSNRLRRSYRGTIDGNSIRFSSDAPYAGIHHKGGKIKVTPQMRRYFWAQYYKLSGQQTRGKSGKIGNTDRNRQLNSQAEFFKNMALTKKPSIVIPKRQVIGNHPRVKEVVDSVAKRAIKEYAEKKLLPTLKKR